MVVRSFLRYMNLRLSVLLIVLLITACAPKIDQLAATVHLELTQTQTNKSTSTLTPTPTFSPTTTYTETPIPSPTSTPTITETPSPTTTPTISPLLIAAIKYDGSNLRFGPSTDYPVVARLGQGTELYLLGQSQDGTWLVVTLPDGNQGWIALELLNLQIDTSSLQKIETPPQPTLYKLTIRNDIYLGHYLLYGPHGDVELDVPDGLAYFSVMLPEGTYKFHICDPWLLLSYNKCGQEFSLNVNSDRTITLSNIFSNNPGSKP